MAEVLQSGDRALLRYRYPDGRLQAALPMRMVRDDGANVVTWLAPGTTIMYWALPDGRDPRALPLSSRFEQHLTTAPRTWQGPGVLRVIPIDQPYQVLHFWDERSAFTGWYVNLEERKTRRGHFFDSVDHYLDLEINASGVPAWKDENEARAAVDNGYLSQDILDHARRTGEAIMAHIEAWPSPIGDWRTYAPPADWTALELPADWDS